MSILDDYARITGNEVIDHLRQLAAPLKGMSLVHVNSTRRGGGVAEILEKFVPLTQALGIHTGWEIITGIYLPPGTAAATFTTCLPAKP